MASKMDLVACCWCFQLPDERVYFLPRFWCTEDADNARQKANKQLIKPWVPKWIRIGSDEQYTGVICQELVQNEIIEDAKKFKPVVVAYDSWNIGDVAKNIAKAGFPIAEFVQGSRSFNGPMKEFEVRVKAGQVRHGGSPVMRFCVKNVMVRPDDNENIRPSKGKSADRIDGVVAAVMALGMSMTYQQVGRYYETNPVEAG